VEEKQYTKIQFESYGQTIEEGYPLVPTYSQTIAVPETGAVSYRVLSSEQEIINIIIF